MLQLHGGRDVLGQPVRAILRSDDLRDRDKILRELLLQPEHIHVFVPDFGNALPLQNAIGRRGVEVELHPLHLPEVIVQGDKPQTPLTTL